MNTKTADPLSQILDTSAFELPEREGQLVVQGSGGQGDRPMPPGLITGVHGDIFTAQRVAQARNMKSIMARLSALGRAAGKDWVYGWEVNDRKNNRKIWIEGPTIKLANDLAREYGNCMVDCRVRDEGANWVFYGRFIDLETGYQMVRAYQQRKGQEIGEKYDAQRAMDMVFQIGQSKCIRNVVVNALQTLADYCVDEAKSGLIERIGKDPETARQWIIGRLDKLGIERKRVEAIYGRSAQHWTVADMARIYTELQSISDGMMNADDVYPLDQPAKESKEPKEPKRSQAGPKGGAAQTSSPDAQGSASRPPAETGSPTAPASGGGDQQTQTSDAKAAAQAASELADKADEAGPAVPTKRGKKGAVNFGDAV